MKNISKDYLLSFLLTTFISIVVCSQHKYNKSFENEFYNKANEYGIMSNMDLLLKHNINVFNYNKLKDIGVDLKSVALAPKNIYEKSMYYSTIVLGTVVERKYLADSKNYFHTEYKVLVKDVIKGNSFNQYLHFKTVSGIVNLDDSTYMKLSSEPQLFLGEEAIFMLNRIDFETLEYEKTINLESSKKIINATEGEYRLYEKYRVSNDKVFNEYKKEEGKLNDISLKIQKIKEVNRGDEVLMKKIKK